MVTASRAAGGIGKNGRMVAWPSFRPAGSPAEGLHHMMAHRLGYILDWFPSRCRLLTIKKAPMSRTISSSTTGPVVLGTADNPLYITSTGRVTSTGSADGID